MTDYLIPPTKPAAREAGAPLFDAPIVRRGPIASVAPAAPIDRVYSYIIPDELADRVVPGVRVRVPIGAAGRLTPGYCIERSEGDWDATLRPVAEVVDDKPLLSAEMLDLGLWIARYYACPMGPTLAVVAPLAARGVSGHRNVRYARLLRLPDEDEARSKQQRAVIDLLRQAQAPAATPPAEHVDPATTPSHTQHSGLLAVDLLRQSAGASNAVIASLKRAGLVAIETRREPREPDWPSVVPEEPTFDLNPEQYAAAERIIAAMAAKQFRVFLLFGVTGSGKTEVYVRAMRHALADGRQAILLVPEIALTTQVVQRLTKRFARVAVLHSGLTPAQRSRAWAAIAAGRVDVVIGPRSAVFAPCPRPGVIIVDEEHEASFKNQAAPRYHTRDVAIKRGQTESIPVVLGTATPSLETWHNVGRLSHYELLRLPRRVADLAPPRLHLVDMRAEHRRVKRVTLLSEEMERYLKATLDRGEQAILLLNRRGYANYLFCPKCLTPIVCPNCGVYVVFHQATDLAHCHYCHERLPVPRNCGMAGCGGTLVRFGMGTERVEEELRVKFPSVRAARMDSDVMVKPSDYADVLGRFERRELDVLVGTQMIAKGLDYPFVSFVGIVSADTALAIDDFRSTERTFQLVLQVAGRSGRSHRGGDVVVQTFNADLPTIRHALNQDYERFAAEELALRKKSALPPATRMMRIVLADARLTRAREGATSLASALREQLFATGIAARIWDAQPCALPRLRNQYRFEVIVTFESASAMLSALDRLRSENALKARVRTLTVDVDPVALL